MRKKKVIGFTHGRNFISKIDPSVSVKMNKFN